MCLNTTEPDTLLTNLAHWGPFILISYLLLLPASMLPLGGGSVPPTELHRPGLRHGGCLLKATMFIMAHLHVFDIHKKWPLKKAKAVIH